jgi:hypothetical protein
MAPKRPRDLNQWAKRMVDLATSSAHEPNANEGKAASKLAHYQQGK